MDSYDYVVIGAGTAGSVLAARLSEDPACRVLLLEAGPDVSPGAEPRDILSVFPHSAFNAAYAWPDTWVHWRTVDGGPAVPLPQGCLVGGSSQIMGMWAMRGMASVYDGWAAMGATGWDWAGVLPYFRRLEHDHDFDGPLHGDAGPIHIRRLPEPAWSPLARAFKSAAVRRGHRDVADMNGDEAIGHCVLPVSRTEHRRSAAGLDYLTPTVRSRPNLEIRARSRAVALRFAAGPDQGPQRVVGVRIRDASGHEHAVAARETVVAAGALRSPVLLQQGGIGDGALLQAAGLPVRLHRPGVGRNLQNHPMLFIVSFLAPAGIESAKGRPAGNNYLRWSSGLPGTAAGDMGMSVRSWLSWHALGRRMGAIAPTVSMPRSRGRVWLQAEAGRAAPRPRIEFDLLGDPRDLQRIMDGFRLAVALYADMQAIAGDPLVLLEVSNISRLMRYNEPTRANAVRAGIAATLMDMAPALGRRWVGRLARMTPAAQLLADPERLAAFALASVSGAGHVAGTCRMGAVSDPGAVVDADGGVIGVAGLRVADASIMPTVTSGGTHLPVIMLAEKLSAQWRARGAGR